MRFHFAFLGLAVLLAQPLPLLAQAAPAPQPAPPSAQPAAPAALTLAAAIQRAFQSNPGLRAASQDIDIARGQRIQAGKFLNPEVSYLREGQQKDRRSTTVQLDQEIELGGKRGARIASGNREIEVASADLATYRANLRADVVTAFFDVVAAQERLALAQSSQELAQRVSGATARRVTAGKISPVEETRARVAEASTKIELSQAANELALARQRLGATWGNKNGVSEAVEAPPATLGAHPTKSELFVHLPGAPQLARAKLEIERQRALADIERSRRIPNLTLSVGSKRDEQVGARQTIVGVSLPLPLFDRNQGNLLSALRRADKARDQLLVTETNLSVELTQASLRLEAAQGELRVLRGEILPGAQSAYEAATKGFELGKFNFLDVLDAQRTLTLAKTQYVRALAESHRAAADIERVVGNVEPHGRLINPTVNPQE
ncbi:MAG: TolC family protein [Pseudomonadota bacterium]